MCPGSRPVSSPVSAPELSLPVEPSLAVGDDDDDEQDEHAEQASSASVVRADVRERGATIGPENTGLCCRQ